MKKNKTSQAGSLLDLVYDGIFKKKGKNVVTLDLGSIENAICRYFVLCNGDSTTQTTAIAESVEEVLRTRKSEKPFHREGYENANWILLDYGDVIVHVFIESYRNLYNLEELWADAKILQIEEQDLADTSN